jgi:hypothetical protein
VSGRRDIRCTVSIGGFVPKPHTPFQWVGQLGAPETDARLAKLRDAIRSDRRYASAIGFRYHDGQPGSSRACCRGATAGSGRSSRRSGATVAVRRLERALLLRALDAVRVGGAGEGPVDVAWYTTRERDQSEVLPWDHLDSGLDKEWLWEDWQEALDETEVDDCRWTPCFDCGVCPQMGTEIEIGPTGKTLLPLTVVGAGRAALAESS